MDPLEEWFKVRIKIKKIMIVFISLILLIPSVCTAAISRHEEDHGCLTYYRIDEKEPGYSVAILLLRDMKLNEWGCECTLVSGFPIRVIQIT